jgi:hypothetical protein
MRLTSSVTLCCQTSGSNYNGTYMKGILIAKTKLQVSCFLNVNVVKLKHSETDLTLVIKSENLNVCETLHKVGCQTAH